MNSKDITLWIDERWYDALSKHLKDETLEEHLENVLDEMCNQLPQREYERISHELWAEQQAEKEAREATRRFAVFHVTEGGSADYFLTEEHMDYLIQVLFRNYVILMRESATYMAAHGIKGSIVNISSVRGLSAHPGDLVYGGIKAALNRACQSVALDVAPYGIRVNNILPGATRRFTPEEEQSADPAHIEKIKFLSRRIPLERYGTPEDIGNAVVFLSSEKASYITGISLVIDGGLSLPGLAETAWEAESGWGKVKREVDWKPRG